jgi:CRP/FNR family transcriptional regulator, cyclic AMP receptor protein
MAGDRDDIAEALARLPALEGAQPRVVDWLVDHVEPVTFSPGQRLVTEGDDDRDCYLLVDGDVSVSKDGGFRDTDHGGGITGELALLYRRPRTATATAVAPVTALRLRAADFDELCRTDPALGRAAAEAIVDYLRFRFGFQPPGRWEPPASPY